MKAFLKKYKYLVIVCLFLSIVYIIVPSMNYTNCLSSQKFREVIIDGVVINKYLDKSQHSTPIVEIQNFLGRIDSVYFFGDHSGIFDRLNVKDTLKKSSGTNEILIRINGKYAQLGVADFKCDSAKLKSEDFLSWIYDLFGTIPANDNTKEK